MDTARQGSDETHVGLRIMNERARRIGACVELVSTPGRGTSVILTLAAPDHRLERPASTGLSAPEPVSA